MTLIDIPPTYQVLHGDALELLRQVPDASIHAVITDPPYGVDFQSQMTSPQRFKKIANDKRPFIWWLHDAYRVTEEGGALLCFCDWKTEDVFKMAIETAGFTIKSQVIWHRDWHGMGDLKAAFGPDHDVVWFAVKGKFAFPGKRPKSVLSVRRTAPELIQHPNEKPFDLMKQLVESVTAPGQIVLDPFCGSGSTGEACAALNRRFIGFDLDDAYVQLSQERIRGRLSGDTQ